jgi:cell division protein ZapA (FtsZ GTPase activity inhibitor)
MAELIPISVVIADRTYRLKIEAGDEEVVRRTVKLLNDKIFDFKSNFAGKDMQDYVSMVLLWFATEQSKTSSPVVETGEIADELAALAKLIDKSLDASTNQPSAAIE